MKVYFRKKLKWELNTIDDLNNILHEINAGYKSVANINVNKILKRKEMGFKEFKTLLGSLFGKDSNRSINHYIKRGWTKEEAVIKISELQKKSSPLSKSYSGYNNLTEYEKQQTIFKLQQNRGISGGKVRKPEHYNTNIEYYLNKGFTIDEAKQKVSERQATYSKDKLIKKYGVIKGIEKLNERNEKWFKTLKCNNDWNDLSIKKTSWQQDSNKREIATEKYINSKIKSGMFVDKNLYDDFELYKFNVRKLTEKQDLSTLFQIEKRSINYHLDHIVSIKEGFLNNIPIHIIANIVNLRIMSAYDNLSKGAKSDMNINELINKIYN